MSQDLDTSLEATLEDEIVRNYRYVEHPTFGRIKLQRPTPRITRLIAEERRKQYHRDLKDRNILSRFQIEQEAMERGIWSKEETRRQGELLRLIGVTMGTLEARNFKTLEDVVLEFLKTQKEMLTLFEEIEEAKPAVERFFDLDNPASPSDKALIFSKAPSTRVDELIEEAERLRGIIDEVKKMSEYRRELDSIQDKESQLFSESIEGRADRAERMAQIYYCCVSDGDKPLWPTFEAMWDAAQEDIEFLILEHYYFTHGITAEFRDILSRHNFIQREPDIAPSSESSPEPPQISSDGEQPQSEEPISSELAMSSS